MSILNQLDKKNKWSYIVEEELAEIYESQYNDVFSKILQLDSTQFINVLEKQIIIHLYLIKKQPILSSLSKISELYIHVEINSFYVMIIYFVFNVKKFITNFKRKCFAIFAKLNIILNYVK